MQSPIDLTQIMPLFSPVYEPGYLEKSQKLLNAIKNKEFTKEINDLAEEILYDDQGDYNAWYVKKMYILSQPKSKEFLQKQQNFVDECLEVKVKGFQIWEQKRFLTELGYDYKSQLQKTQDVLLKKDQKNYHAWSYRVWLTNYGKIHINQLQFALRMIQKDPYNNSAWSYLYFSLEKTAQSAQTEQKKKQLLNYYINFTIEILMKNKSNRAGWNFLRGLFPSIRLKKFPCKNIAKTILINSYDEYSQIYEYCQSEWKQFHQNKNKGQSENLQSAEQIEVLATLVHIHSLSDKQESVGFAKNICEELKGKEPLRLHYWSWVQNNVE